MMKFSVKFWFHFLLYFALAYFTYLMILITLQYIPIDFGVAFLVTKEQEIQLLHYQVAFFTHVYTSIFVLIFGAFQFSKILRKKIPKLHKFFGKLYVFLILFFAAPSGFVMGVYGNGGISTQVSFCVLALLWFYFTLQAYLKIRKKDFSAHQNFMILSYALTLSAISLRLFKWIITNTLQLPPMDTYRIVSWLGWIFNIVIAGIIIFYQKKNPLN